MANNDIIVSEMTSATQINTGDLMIMTQPDLQSETGYSTKKGTVLQVANKMLKGTEYTTDLPDFTDKTVLGGLEELKGDLTSLLPVDTASGAIANFDTDLALDLVSCKASIVASQPSGTPTPSSPLAISGYTGVNLTRCGVNLFSVNSRVGQTTAYVTYTSDDNYIYLNGTKNGGGYAVMSGLTATLPTGTYYLKAFAVSGTASNTVSLYGFDGSDSITADLLGGERTLTLSEPTTFGFRFAVWADGTVLDNYKVGIVITTASGISAFTPYNGTTYAVSWQDEAGTVYGGNIDLTTGLLTVTWGYTALSALTWYYNAGKKIFYSNSLVSELKSIAGGDIYNALSNDYEVVSVNTLYNNDPDNSLAIGYIYSDKNVNVIDNRYTNATDFKNNVTGVLVYELATPVTYQLTPTQVRALVGVNNVFNDTNGNTEVSYKEGIQHYIDKKIAQTQALIL